MLYYLSQQLLEWSAGTVWAEILSPLRLFRYITFRSAGAALTALLISWWLGARVIAWLKTLKFGQEYADKAETGGSLAARLFSKKGTPTMGGILIGLALTIATVVGSSNAVNLTDGLDGLAIGCMLIVSVVFVVWTYLAGNVRAAAYLQIPYVPGAGELTVFCSAMIGAGLGFLWFNCHPAQVFMGDTGSLALGGSLGIMAVLIHQPLVLVIAGGVFVMEAGSVIIQTGWFRYTRPRYGPGRRVFLMAPIHHPF